MEMAPAFAKLRNPVVRRTVAKIATLEQAAKIGGVDLQAMILKLRAAAGAEGRDELKVPFDSACEWRRVLLIGWPGRGRNRCRCHAGTRHPSYR